MWSWNRRSDIRVMVIIGVLALPSPHLLAHVCWFWERVAIAGSNPPAVSHHAMAYDSRREVTVLFGGLIDSSGNAQDQTWVWNGAVKKWAQAPWTSPSPRYAHAMAYDVARGVVVLFGGGASPEAPGNELNDTWLYGETGWTQAFPQGDIPGRRLGHVMAYDATREETVLFGGRVGDTILGDTWVWDGVAWTLRAASGPLPREYAAMAYEPACGTTLLFGGLGDSRFGDTWRWDGAAWVDVTVAGGGPSPRYGSALAYDAMQSGLWLYGGNTEVDGNVGETWVLSGCSGGYGWQTPGPNPGRRVHSAMVFDAPSEHLLLFGGLAGPDDRRSDTWLNKIVCIPATSTWGLAGLGLLIVIAATLQLRRYHRLDAA